MFTHNVFICADMVCVKLKHRVNGDAKANADILCMCIYMTIGTTLNLNVDGNANV